MTDYDDLKFTDPETWMRHRLIANKRKQQDKTGQEKMATTKDAEETNLRDAWIKFERGDHLSDEEIEDLIISASVGLNYLSARRERFVSFKTRCDLEALRSMKKWRENK